MQIDAFLELWANNKGGAPSRVLAEGRDADAKYNGRIVISSFDFGAESSDGDDVLNPTSEGKKLSSSYAPISFKVDKLIDSSSPALLKAYQLMFSKLVNRELPPFSKATVTLRKVGMDKPIEYATFMFAKVVLVSFSMSVKDDGTTSESLTFRFQSCAVSYAPQDDSGGKVASREQKGWNFAMNDPDWMPTH